jgi:serpin B
MAMNQVLYKFRSVYERDKDDKSGWRSIPFIGDAIKCKTCIDKILKECRLPVSTTVLLYDAGDQSCPWKDDAQKGYEDADLISKDTKLVAKKRHAGIAVSDPAAGPMHEEPQVIPDPCGIPRNRNISGRKRPLEESHPFSPSFPHSTAPVTATAHPASLTDRLAAILAPGSFFSPVSIELALALVAAGAQGQTLVELQQAMHWPTTTSWKQELALSFAPLYAALVSDPSLIAVACRVYSRAPLRPKYAADVMSVFRAGIEQLESAAQINEFVSQSTRGIIRSIVDERMIKYAMLVAVNALYFKGQWAVAFRQEDTRVAAFNVAGSGSSQCHMMRTPEGHEWHYHEDETAQYVKLPYRDASGAISAFAALVVLPRSCKADALEGTDWRGAFEHMATVPKTKGALWLPRFELETSVELSSALKMLGARRAFEDSAEFAGISGEGLKIDKVFHKVKVKVDEEGTVAAAVTAVIMFAYGPCRVVPRFEMTCDRPFAFCIFADPPSLPGGAYGARCKPLVLFAGTVANPGTVGPKPQEPQPAPFLPHSRMFPGFASDGPIIHSSPAGWIGPGPVAAPIVSQLTWHQRCEQACLFAPACRRDVHRVLCSAPRGPLESLRSLPPSHSKRRAYGRHAFDSAEQPAPALQWLFTFASGRGAFTRVFPNSVGVGDRNMPAAKVAYTLQAIELVGQPTELGLAFTEAFELLLATEYVPWWSDDDARRLSISFTAAFGCELTPRLDLSHALRSRVLDKGDVKWLKGLPPTAAPYVRGLLDAFL